LKGKVHGSTAESQDHLPDMKKLKNTILLNSYFFLGFSLFLTLGFFFLLYASKAGSFLYLNTFHNQQLDLFFVSYTNFGDGLFSIGLVIILLFMRRFNFAWQMLAAYLISGLAAQLLKHLVSSPRPREFFQAKDHIHIIDGITGFGNSSFPSGHTASAFALATILALFSVNKKLSCIYLIAAILVAYSRIYLSQHFLNDVLAGAVIGVSVAIFVHSFFNAKPGRAKKASRIEEEAILIG
jgi:membrane-associated phospholipid phosphatase